MTKKPQNKTKDWFGGQAPKELVEAFQAWCDKFGTYKQSLMQRIWMRACTRLSADESWLRDLFELAKRSENDAALRVASYLQAGAIGRLPGSDGTPGAAEGGAEDVHQQDQEHLHRLQAQQERMEETISRLANDVSVTGRWEPK